MVYVFATMANNNIGVYQCKVLIKERLIIIKRGRREEKEWKPKK